MRHTGTITLETPRLILRRFAAGDAAAMYRNWASDPEVTRFLTWPPHESLAVSEQVLADWIHGYDDPRQYQWAIVPRSVGEPIGSISIVKINDDIDEIQMGYCIGQKWWHQGYTSEALEAVIRFAFTELGASTLPETMRAVADTAVLTAACAKKLDRDEIYAMLMACC